MLNLTLHIQNTARLDDTKGTGPGWERFEFDKDAPLDDEEIEGINLKSYLITIWFLAFEFYI